MSQDNVKPGYRRKNVYIDKDFQTRFILKFCALVAIGSGLTIVVLYLLSQQSTSVSFVQARVKVMTTADFILPLMVQTVLVVLGFVGFGTIAVTLFVSHKIAGPLFRFKQTFKDLAAGNFSNQVRLRKDDQLVEVAGDFNHMITVVRAQLIDTKKALAALKTDMEAIGEFNVEDSKRKQFLSLQHKVQDMEKTLEFFKT
jgi:nitrogen fixation/metabolism regulation signal transduction histidine kinase